ncbi:MAG TPA: UDP-3-O-acyl-N-acetylglucosamine deacetylase [Labilithrix sp.]|nr:UDP-3-O-acyl-N-acetylglucosamine deacetylase [Labilithrix sp.]
MIALRGHGLHGGAPASVRLVREAGAVRLRAGGAEARMAELVLDGRDRSTSATTRDGRIRVRTVEHLFAALGALSIRDGVVIEIDGPEVPLLDGGARAWLDALLSLGVDPSPTPLWVMRRGSIEVGPSRYEFHPPEHPNDIRIEVDVDFGDARLERHARWEGGAADFYERIALARTFGFDRDIGELLERGLASHVAPESVVVIAFDEILSAGRPFSSDEPARHKLLDLVGDLYAHGGPCVGSLRATRPGHAATHEAIRRGLESGLLMVTRTR